MSFFEPLSLTSINFEADLLALRPARADAIEGRAATRATHDATQRVQDRR
jgi:hypothetical protein